jgi:putative FmdB family regulatory protein
MPIYEYECEKCGHVFEVRQSFSDEPIKSCNQKGCSGKVHKLFSPPAIIFKGSGFYVTDYGRGSGGRKNGTTSSHAKSDSCKNCDGGSCPKDS